MLLGGSNFELSNLIFRYGLSAFEIAVYAYLKSCSGTRDACQVKINTIAKHSGCSVSSVRRALHSLRDKGFIDIKGNAQMLKSGGHRQTCNRYYLLDHSEWKLPESVEPATVTGEMYE